MSEDTNRTYNLTVQFDKGETEHFTSEGLLFKGDLHPGLFLDEVKNWPDPIKEPKKGEIAYVKNKLDSPWELYIFLRRDDRNDKPYVMLSKGTVLEDLKEWPKGPPDTRNWRYLKPFLTTNIEEDEPEEPEPGPER